MKKNKLISLLCVLIVVIAVLHILAMRYNLYFSIWWLDLPIHLLGGFWAGLFTIFYWRRRASAEHQHGARPSRGANISGIPHRSAAQERERNEPQQYLGALSRGPFYFLVRAHRKLHTPSARSLLYVGVGGTIIFGFLWELYEYMFGFTYFTESSYALDTILDILMDVSGGMAAVFYAVRNKLSEI